MDFKLKQWRNQHESKQQHSSNVPKILFEFEPYQSSASAQVLPFFVPDSNTKVSTLSALSDSTLPATRFPRMGCYFLSFAQWQELELQALIFRYIISGAPVPPQLLQPIRKSFLHSPPYFLQHPLQHYHPALLESGYWGRAALDAEPGWCRRTDGKKWQCSGDVVAGQKYCERHLHRGRNHSRKPVEQCDDGVIGGSLGVTTFISAPHSLPPASLKSPFDLQQLNERSSGSKKDRSLFENQDHEGWSDGHILKHLFDGWPRALEEPNNGESNAGTVNSGTHLSISMPGNASSDVSLKLSTGNVDDPCPRNGNVEAQQVQLNWGEGLFKWPQWEDHLQRH